MPANLDIRLALLISGILHKVIIQLDFVLWVERDDRTPAVQEGSKTLSSSDFNTVLDAWVIPDTTDQHGADGDDCCIIAGRTLDYHDRPAILAENIEGTWFVDCLWVDGVVSALTIRSWALKSRIFQLTFQEFR